MISFIAAMDENRVIGKNNGMPWHLPADLKHFKKVTNGHPIIMGRKTYESIGRPLPGRTNIILTRDREYKAEGCKVIHSVSELDAYHKDAAEVFVIGGAAIFEQTFPLADRMYLTIIHETFSGDTYFPEWDEKEWVVTSEEKGTVDEKNQLEHTYITLDRNY